MEPRFGYDFSRVQVHDDTNVARSAEAIAARAYTFGQHIVFGAARYAPNSSRGRRLLAHELTHVMQQGSTLTRGSRNAPVRGQAPAATMLQRAEAEEPPSAKPVIDYARAEKRNKFWASRLGWNKRLKAIRPGWDIRWQLAPAHFADAVAAFQVEQGFKGRQVNGVLNPRTWDRLRPIGEVIAKGSADWGLSQSLCYEATRERLAKGYRRATGKRLVPKEERQTFRIILGSNAARMRKAGIEKKYWGTSAAGALVALGKGEFVSKNDIWSKKALKPGAVIQVWSKQRHLERVKKGEKVPWGSGTSAVFIKYTGKASMEVLHFGKSETWKQSDREVWIGANLLAR
jgi:hypothetical protein